MHRRTYSFLVTVCLSVLQAVAGLQINDDFRTSKNIVFAGIMGGSSHMNWVLNILDEVAARGHNVTFVTKDDQIRFGKPYPRINTISLGKQTLFPADVMPTNFRPKMINLMAGMLEAINGIYVEDFNKFMALFENLKADVVLCDHFATICVDAAKASKLPFIVTSTMALSPDSSAPYINNDMTTSMGKPTTINMSFLERFYDKFILPLEAAYIIHKPAQNLQKIKQQIRAPMDSPADPWKDGLKIVHGAFGFEAARPMGPLVEMVGPIVNPHYSPLTPELTEFLDQHKRIVYIAFGQHATPTESDITLLMAALMDNIEKGVIDGFLWATVNAGDRFPKTITTLSKRTYDLTDILEGRNDHCRLVKWAPQQALLLHPSVAAFLTHGGISSIHESLLARTRLIVYPFFGDQPQNAHTVANNRVGGHISHQMSPKSASSILKRIVLDSDGEIQRSVDQYSAFIHVRTKSAAARGADLVEEVAYMHKDGKLPHRYDVARQMSYIKAHNIDLYAALLSVVGFLIAVVWTKIKPALARNFFPEQKLKTI